MAFDDRKTEFLTCFAIVGVVVAFVTPVARALLHLGLVASIGVAVMIAVIALGLVTLALRRLG